MTRFKDLRKPKLLRFISSQMLKTYIHLSLKFKLKQKYKLPEGPKIFTPNHPTTLDPFIIASTFPNAKMLVHVHAYKVGILAWLLNSLGHIPADVRKGADAYNQAKKALENGHDIIIFPEGNYSIKAQTPRNFKTGVVRLALETNTPIIPIGIQVNPEKIEIHIFQSSDNVDLYNNWYSKGKYIINIGKSIKLKGNPKNREYVKKKSRYLQDEIQKLCRK